MKIEGKEIAQIISSYLKKEVKGLKKKPHLAVFMVEGDKANRSFVRLKRKAVDKIGGKLRLTSYKTRPPFEELAYKIRSIVGRDNITGAIIQKPLPPELSTQTLYDYIPEVKEIEGYKKKSPFTPPIGLAVLTMLKYIFKPNDKKDIDNALVDMEEDVQFFKNVFKKKSVVLVGKGETGGAPIGEVLTKAKINYINIHSKTPNPELFYKEADVIITAVGKKVIHPELLKPGVALVNVGIRRKGRNWKGDYDEDEIERIAGFYTSTPGGIGPVDVAYLTYNLVEATKMQQ